ncbi:EF-Tu/IF-2/RF-3 family GTPase [Microlunatus soli]|uniref:Selenocysteine-specific elongation factor n=1 Tax=Microlunatus soli TaxID=630515 RepID=A0A1H1UQ76_9ACTN|nr:EF-Tu/IF-2/RF-3 family GTPase [Microlunatus soli]SDS74708.1 selenocysteine-specific elongation factor [Microlunatus soli]
MGWLFGRRKKSEAQQTLEQLQAQSPGLRSPFDVAPTADAPAEVPAYGSTDFSLLVEDVFVITGRGCVVTGTVTAGVIGVGAQVTIAAQSGGQSDPYQVAAIEAFRELRETAQTGDNVGLLLPGLTREQVGRGDRVIA